MHTKEFPAYMHSVKYLILLVYFKGKIKYFQTGKFI